MERHGCLCTRGEDRTQPGYGSLRVASQWTCSAASLFIPSLYGGDGTLLTRGRGSMFVHVVKTEHSPYMDLCVCVCVWPAGKSAEMVLPPWVET
jgi:hypothetical protein